MVPVLACEEPPYLYAIATITATATTTPSEVGMIPAQWCPNSLPSSEREYSLESSSERGSTSQRNQTGHKIPISSARLVQQSALT